MKLLLDMGISVHLIPELQASGHEAAHIAEIATERLPDSEILAKARAGNYVLLVHDLDFPDLHGRKRFLVAVRHRFSVEEHASGERPGLSRESPYGGSRCAARRCDRERNRSLDSRPIASR